MKFYIDDVNLEKIQELWPYYPVEGVTSNPTILKKYGKDPVESLKKVREFIGPKAVLMTQVISTKAEGMVQEAHKIADLLGHETTYVKFPANPEGLKAIKQLKDTDILTNATGIYSAVQGMLAAEAGADMLAPYVNRIDMLGGDGIQVTKDIFDILKAHNLKTEICAASFKTTRQVVELAKYGITRYAINVELWEAMLKNATVDSAIDRFNQDFADLMGEGITWLDLL